MNTNTTSTSFISENRKFLVVLFIVFLLSSVGMFGQTKTEVTPVCETTTTTICTETVKAVAFDSDVDFMNWFMGSKQVQTIQKAAETATTVSRKKQIISSGVTPNKVLYRTFMKRVISQETAIA
ncbi:hypothetical protein GCM10022389_22910 [Flavobacterium cheonanense]|uniref:Uncharacterized protein n=1 Tax=Flavobacterium cheonanense TaxID=706183 RepID=A0ABP7VX72_9FLAO